MGDIGTYVDEMTVKFIIGQEPLANYDAYVQQVKSMNVDRALELQQAAVERYLNRGK
jgi:putative aldouronate transport system substrate-binding protein